MRSVRLTGAALLLAAAAAPAFPEMVLPPSVDPGQEMSVEVSPPAASGGEFAAQPITGPQGAERPAGPPVPLGVLEPGAELARLAAPRQSGSYWLELYVGGRLRERAALEVVAAPIGLWAPAEVHPTAPFEIRLSIGGAPAVDLVIEDRDTVLIWEAQISAAELASSRLAIPAPDHSGTYLLQVIDPPTGTVLASRRFSVDAGKAWFRAPSVITAGEGVRVDRFGPGGVDHALVIVSEATGALVLEQTLAGSEGARDTVVLPGPRKPGRYRLRYVSLLDGNILADVVLIVTAD